MRNNQLTSVCYVCGAHLRGPWPADGELSHGLCDLHYQQKVWEIKEWLHRKVEEERLEVPAVAA